MTTPVPRLILLPRDQYRGVNHDDPLRFYYWPVLGRIYRRRMELCLGECRGGSRVLEVGFGSGIAFMNLKDQYAEIYGLDLTASVEEVQADFVRRGVPINLRAGDVLHMPYKTDTFDTVLLISILEHLRPAELDTAFGEIRRVLKPGGQMVYGTPVERPFMVLMFRLLGYNIHHAHFSTEKQIAAAAKINMREERILQMKSIPPVFGVVYNVGHFVKD